MVDTGFLAPAGHPVSTFQGGYSEGGGHGKTAPRLKSSAGFKNQGYGLTARHWATAFDLWPRLTPSVK